MPPINVSLRLHFFLCSGLPSDSTATLTCTYGFRITAEGEGVTGVYCARVFGVSFFFMIQRGRYTTGSSKAFLIASEEVRRLMTGLGQCLPPAPTVAYIRKAKVYSIMKHI